MTRPDTPCIRVCKQDAAAGFCIGCGRTVREVFYWSDMSAEDREAAIAQLPGRLSTLPDRDPR